jgi:hypothetical protein
LFNEIRVQDSVLIYAPSFRIQSDGTSGGILITPGTYRNAFKRFLLNRARGASMLVSAEYLKRLIPFSENDLYDKWIIFHALAEEKAAICMKPLDYYRVHSDNMVGTAFKFRSRENLVEKLKRETDFYRELETSLGAGNRYSGTFLDLVDFHGLLVKTLNHRNFAASLHGYFRYVVKNGLGIKDNLVYFYYLFIR